MTIPLSVGMRSPIGAAKSTKELDWVPQVFGREVAAESLKRQRTLVAGAFAYWRQYGFPYPTASTAIVSSELEGLGRVGATNLAHTLAFPSTVGLRLANSFHPQMWSARVRGRSPLACFEHDPTLQKCLEKAVRFWPDRRCWNPRGIRIVTSIQNRARVSNFRPTVARALIDKFSEANSELLDFSSGYGGRLLAAISLGRRYVGIDPAAGQCRGLRKMAADLGGHATIHRGCAEDILPLFPDRKFGLIFSSPPYFRLERYEDHPLQSCVRYPSYDQWKAHFLEPVIEHSYRLLHRNGLLILNIADIPGYPIARDALSIALPFFGSQVRVLRMSMSSNPADKDRRGKLKRTEPIFVFKR